MIESITVPYNGKVLSTPSPKDIFLTVKSARIAEKIIKKIGIDIDVKPETVTEENLAPAEKESAPESAKEATPTVEPKKEEAPKTEMKKEAPKAETKTEKT